MKQANKTNEQTNYLFHMSERTHVSRRPCFRKIHFTTQRIFTCAIKVWPTEQGFGTFVQPFVEVAPFLPSLLSPSPPPRSSLVSFTWNHSVTTVTAVGLTQIKAEHATHTTNKQLISRNRCVIIMCNCWYTYFLLFHSVQHHSVTTFTIIPSKQMKAEHTTLINKQTQQFTKQTNKLLISHVRAHPRL